MIAIRRYEPVDLDMMFVHPAHQRLGVATALLATVESVAREQGLSRLFTEASITARPFFERHGFRVIRQRTVHRRGQDLTNFAMEKGALQRCVQLCG